MQENQSAPSERLRRDATENRAKLIDAARTVFSEQGTDAPLEAIASTAGVGIATLYRRFPAREDLLATIVSEELEQYLRVLDEALAYDDTWQGFSHFLEQTFQLQARHPGLCHAPFMQLPNASSIDEGRALMTQKIEELIERAVDQGSLRADATTTDVTLAGWGNAGIITNPTPVTPETQKRYLTLMLDALKAK